MLPHALFVVLVVAGCVHSAPLTGNDELGGIINELSDMAGEGITGASEVALTPQKAPNMLSSANDDPESLKDLVKDLDQAIAEGTSDLDTPQDPAPELEKVEKHRGCGEGCLVKDDPDVEAEHSVEKSDAFAWFDQDAAPKEDTVVAAPEGNSVEGDDTATADDATSAKVHAATHTEEDHNDSYSADRKAEKVATGDAPAELDKAEMEDTVAPAVKMSATVHAAAHTEEEHNDTLKRSYAADKAAVSKSSDVDVNALFAGTQTSP